LDIREPLTKAFPHMNLLTSAQEAKVDYVLGDISDPETVKRAFSGVEAVFHIAAAVGPFIAQPVFHKVNVVGTQNVIDACKANNIRKLVASSSPSVFFTGQNISGLRPKELKIAKPGQFLATYAETKAIAERLVREANNPPTLMTINVAPHQVYGPRDTLFLPNFMFAKDQLRIMGSGRNRVSMTHVDNYSHGLILALDALEPSSPALGQFYIVTDDKPQNLWEILDRAVVRAGGTSVYDKFRVPSPIMYAVAYVAQFLGWFTGIKFRITPFNVTMLTIDRFFNIEDAKRDLKYTPLKTFDQGWEETLQWFQANPDFTTICAQSSLQGKAPDVKKKA
jgi:nucleoside-diphosphate-sugar epimerase